MRLKISSAKCRPFCLGLNGLLITLIQQPILGHSNNLFTSAHNFAHVQESVLRLTDQFHKSQNAPVPYYSIPRDVPPEQKYAHFCSEWSIVGYGTDAFWDECIWSILDYCVKTVTICSPMPLPFATNFSLKCQRLETEGILIWSRVNFKTVVSATGCTRHTNSPVVSCIDI